ncbi:hypothetical protein GCM10022254_68490 [Actinomadura meridiana]|uniref:DUF6879 domain-containing protein n=1 Tax=Actinomadura meridiana TaxID=559626 RepID=A0ABP8CMG4_9ACTN
MLNRISDLPATFLGPEEYRSDAGARFAAIDDFFWKLERRQSFQEEDDDGYRAFMRGDWDGAQRMEARALGALRRRFESVGFEYRRVRIVERPVSPYLQWEMQALRVRAEAGEGIRVLDAEAVHGQEEGGLLPEVVIVGTGALYEVGYDQAGVHNGARRIVDQEVIGACRAEMAVLWDKGEDLASYVTREIDPLPPPLAQL